MTRVRFEPFVKWFRGRMNGMVFRLSHNGQTSAYLVLDTAAIVSHVIWSQAQKDHRRHMKEAWIYAERGGRRPGPASDVCPDGGGEWQKPKASL